MKQIFLAHNLRRSLIALLVASLSFTFVPLTAQAVPPPAPTATGFSSLAGNAAARLQWNPSANATSYIVTRTKPATPALSITTTKTYLEISPLTNTAQTFTVRAVNNTGPSAAALTISVTPLAIPAAANIWPPATITTALSATRGQVNVTLTLPKTGVGGGAPPLAATTYRVDTRIVGTTAWTSGTAQTVAAGTLVRSISGLVAGNTYEFRAVTNALTQFVQSAPILVAYTPGAPTGLSATPKDRSIDLTWSAPANTGSPVTGYLVNLTSGGSTEVIQTNSSNTAHTITNLEPGVSYTATVESVNALGASPASSSVTAIPFAAPSAPRDPQLTLGDGATSFTLNWTAPSDNNFSPITGYRIQQTSPSSVLIDANNQATSKVITGLTPGETYTFEISAINAAGFGPVVTVTKIAGERASAPTSLSAVVVGTNIELDWIAPTSEGTEPIVGYSIEYRVSGSETWLSLDDDTGSLATEYLVSELPSGSYDFQVAANTILTGEWSAAASVSGYVGEPSVPEAPRNFKAASGDGSSNLSWELPENDGGSVLTGFIIQKLVAGFWLDEATVAADQTSYSVTSLVNGQRYFFRVLAVNARGESEASESDSVVPSIKPDAPTNLSASYSSANNQIILEWVAPVSTGSSALDGYQIEQNTGSGWVIIESNTNSSDTTYVLTDPPLGETTLFRVTAINESGAQSDPSNEFEIEVPVLTVPDEPTSVQVAAGVNGIGTGKIRVSWTAPVSSGGSTVLGYRVEYRLNQLGSSWTVAVADTESTSTDAVVSGLTNGTSYIFRVRALNILGFSNASASSSAIAPVATVVPNRPTLVTATNVDGEVSLNWSAPAFDGGAEITGYRIDRLLNGKWSRVTSAAGTGNANTSLTVSGLVNGSKYRFRVQARNIAGWSALSAMSSQILVSQRPNSVANLSSSIPVRTTGQIRLSWSAPNANGGTITSYVIEKSTDSGVTWQVVDPDTKSAVTSYLIKGLPGNTSYRFRIFARNASGLSVASNIASCALPMYGSVPSTALSVKAAPVLGGAEISWKAPTNNGGQPLLGYWIERQTLSPAVNLNWIAQNSELIPANQLTYSASGLTNGSGYKFRVRAVNINGMSVPSAATSTVIPGAAPFAVSNLVAESLNEVVNLTWTSPSSIGSRISGYLIEQKTGSGDWSVIESDTGTSANSYTVTGLTNGTEYSFRIKAINTFGPATSYSNVVESNPFDIVEIATNAVAAYEAGSSTELAAAQSAVGLLPIGATRTVLQQRIDSQTSVLAEIAAQQAAETAVADYENNGSGTKSDADNAISALDPGAFKTALENRVTAETAVRAYEAGEAGDKAAADTAISALDPGAIKTALENRVTARFNALAV